MKIISNFMELCHLCGSNPSTLSDAGYCESCARKNDVIALKAYIDSLKERINYMDANFEALRRKHEDLKRKVEDKTSFKNTLN